MSEMKSIQDMIFDLWSCTYIDPDNGQRYWRMQQESDPPTPPPEPENPADESEQ